MPFAPYASPSKNPSPSLWGPGARPPVAAIARAAAFAVGAGHRLSVWASAAPRAMRRPPSDGPTSEKRASFSRGRAAVAVAILAAWFCHGADLLERRALATESTPVIVLRILLQAYLTTGLFITAHDAMHGTVHPRRQINDAIGRVACFLFAGMSYGRLVRNHGLHHAAPASAHDPDYCASPSFIVWFATFMARYTTVMQLIVMATLFNLLSLKYEQKAIFAFWVTPALLASLQLFYFGTFVPHRPPHDPSWEPFRARTLPKMHVVAMLTCYFFGYHREHHASPKTPWFLLYLEKEQRG